MLKCKVVIVFVCMIMCMSLDGMEYNPLKIKTTDKKIVKLPFSVLESSTLLYEQYVSKKAKKIEKIIVFAPVNKANFDLFKKGVISLKTSKIDFEKYYEKVEEDGLLRDLINVAGKLKSSELTARLVSCFFPEDLDEYIGSFIKKSAIEALRYKIIKKNCDQCSSSIVSVGTDLSCVKEPMLLCSCASLILPEETFSHNPGSVFVQVDPLGSDAPILVCKKSGRSLALLGHDSPIVSVHFSFNDATLLTCSYNDVSNQHRMILWDIHDFECQGVVRQIKMIKGYDSIRKIVFSSSGEVFVVALENGIFRIYSGIDGGCIQYKGLYNRVGNKIKGISCPGIFFGCEDKLLIMMNFGSQSSCSMWDTFTGKKICGLNDKFRPFKAGYFSADGFIVTACIEELLGGECFDLCGEENRDKLEQLVQAIKPNILSVYALWRWCINNEKSYLLSDEDSPLNKLLTYFQDLFV